LLNQIYSFSLSLKKSHLPCHISILQYTSIDMRTLLGIGLTEALSETVMHILETSNIQRVQNNPVKVNENVLWHIGADDFRDVKETFAVCPLRFRTPVSGSTAALWVISNAIIQGVPKK